MTAASHSVLLLTIIVVLQGCGSDSSDSARLRERDILEIAAERPLEVSVAGTPARFGDPELAMAVDRMSDVPRPWTVPRIAALFDSGSGAWLGKLTEVLGRGDSLMWSTADAERERLGDLARVLASSRDARAAVVLGRTLDNEDHPAGWAVAWAIFDYFLDGDIYHGLPAGIERKPVAGHLYDYAVPAVERWWDSNRERLEAEAAARRKGL